MEKKLLTILFFITLALSEVQLFAQYTYSGYHLAAIPPSPNASSLGVYGVIPIEKYTGAPKIQIPIYNIKNGDAECEISLSYHIDENKVDQEASWVGLGWALNAGGVVTRVRRGLSDLTVDGGVTSHTYGYQCCTFYQPDDFYFNFPNHTGHFILDQQNNPILISQSDLIIETINGTDSGFTILCPDGTKYVFDKKEYTFVSELTGPIDSIHYYFPSSWYLSKIISPTYHEISFSYTSTTCPSISYSLIETYNNLQDLGGTGYCTGMNLLPENEYIFIRTIQYNIYPIKIDFGVGEINFLTDDRVDLLSISGYSLPKRLSEISITDTLTSEIVKIMDFNTSYFISSGSNPDYLGKRLKLDSIVEKNIYNEPGSIYSFEYVSTLLPSKYSKSTDYWGFYNGVTYSPETTVNNRNFSSNSVYSKACLLNKIMYPTGGYTTFEYEGNTFSNRSNMNMGGGNRIKKIVSFNNDDIQCTEKWYEYTTTDGGAISSGKLILPVLNQYPVLAVSVAVCNGVPVALYSIYNTTAKGNCLSLGTGSTGTIVGYSRVVEFQDEIGSNGKTEFQFENSDISEPASFDDLIKAYYQRPTRNGLLSSLVSSAYVDNSYEARMGVYNSYSEEDTIITIAEFPNIAYRILSQLDCTEQNKLYVDFEIKSSWIHPTSSMKVEYPPSNPQDSIVETTYYFFESNNHKQLTREATTNDTVTLSTTYRYPDEFLSDSAAEAMFAFHRIDKPIETIKMINDKVVYSLIIENIILNASYLQGTLIKGLTLPYRFHELRTNFPLTDYQYSDAYLNFDSRIMPVLEVESYDEYANELQLKKTDNINISYLWGYNNEYLVSKVENSIVDNIGYDSFEEAAGWSPEWMYLLGTRSDTYSKTGHYSMFDAQIIITANVTSTISLWSKNITSNEPSIEGYSPTVVRSDSCGWTYYEWEIAPENIVLTAEDCYIDEVRQYPVDAMMITYTYDPLIGMTSETDPNGKTTYYEYDSFGRLKYVKDYEHNIVKEYVYHLKRSL